MCAEALCRADSRTPRPQPSRLYTHPGPLTDAPPPPRLAQQETALSRDTEMGTSVQHGARGPMSLADGLALRGAHTARAGPGVGVRWGQRPTEEREGYQR